MEPCLDACDWSTSGVFNYKGRGPFHDARRWGWCERCKRLRYVWEEEEVETSMEGRGSDNSTLKRKVVEGDVRVGSLWLSVPDDILCLVFDKIRCIEDYVRLCAVCRSWYSFGTDYYFRCKRHQFAPLFMLKEDPNSDTTQRVFHNHISGTEIVLDLPEASGRRCWGSPFGWIVTFSATDLELTLLNPFSRASIALPSLRTLLPGATAYHPNRRFIKAILTASPESPDCLVVLIIKGSRFRPRSKVGFARPGIDSAWWRVEGCPNDINDVVWFKGGLYGSRRTSFELVLIQLQVHPPHCSIFAVMPPVLEQVRTPKSDTDLTSCWDNLVDPVNSDYFRSIKYVADIGGELCLVLRYAIRTNTYHFKVFKIDINTKEWARISPFSKDQCLFVGNHNTFTYTCTCSGFFEPNLVYYTHDRDNEFSPNGVDEGVHNSPALIVERTEDKSTSCPSLWITPCLQFSRLDPSAEIHGPPKKLRRSYIN